VPVEEEEEEEVIIYWDYMTDQLYPFELNIFHHVSSI
jgi:hypothetical protein